MGIENGRERPHRVLWPGQHPADLFGTNLEQQLFAQVIFRIYLRAREQSSNWLAPVKKLR
jgi:hypothetical protein